MSNSKHPSSHCVLQRKLIAASLFFVSLICLVATGCQGMRSTQRTSPRATPINVNRQPARTMQNQPPPQISTVQTVAYQEPVLPLESSDSNLPETSSFGRLPEPANQPPNSLPQIQNPTNPMRLREPDAGMGFSSPPNMTRPQQAPMTHNSYSNSANPSSLHQRSHAPLSPNAADRAWNGPTTLQTQSLGNRLPPGWPGVNVAGDEFRIPAKTATELMIELKDENIGLNNQILSLQHQIKQLNDSLRAEHESKLAVDAELSKSKLLNQQLSESLAKLQVRFKNLEAEKNAVEARADKALREIEANLDAALMDTITTARGEDPTAGRRP